MPNKKINQLDNRVISGSDLLLIGDPVTGTSYKSLVTGLGLVYVPYTGATANVDLGEYELKAGQIELDQTPTGTAGVAVTRWNDTVGTIETTLKGGNVVFRHGRDMFERVVNKTGIQLTKAAYQAVRVSDAQGQRLAVNLAQANNDNNSADTIGLVVETIDNNQEGYIYTVGELSDINTTGALQGETWADGDVLYLSPTTPGRITNVKPIAPQHLVIIGYVVYAHSQHGKIYIKITNGFELSELHDVDTTGATNGQVLKYNGTIWTPSSDLDTGITSLNGLTALTQIFATGTSGADFNISSATSTHTFNLPTASATNRGLVSSSDWSTFNAKIGGTLATGQVAFGSAANTIAGSNNLFWDNTNNRLGIGTNAPASSLQIASAATLATGIQFNNAGSIGYLFGDGVSMTLRAGNTFGVTVNTSSASLTQSTTSTGGFRIDLQTLTSAPIYSFLSDGDTGIGRAAADTLTFFAGGEKARIFSTGNLLLQNGGTFTDGGQRLQVQGDAFIKGSGNTSSTTALTVQNSDGASMLRVRNDFRVFFGGANVINAPYIAPRDASSSFLFIASNSAGASAPTSGAINLYNNLNNFTYTSGNGIFANITADFAPTSGTGTFAGLSIINVINQTGGANGITRGLYVNPTLTAAADWRSIEMSNNSGWGIYQSGASANNYFAGKIVVGTTTVSTFALDVNGTARVTTSVSTGTLNATNWSYGDSFGNTKSINTQGVNAGTKLGITDVNSYTGTSNQVHLSVANTGFAPTSGTGTFIGLALAHTVNQTGTATGITRGLYVTPILTAAADWRSIEWANNTGWGLRGAGTAPNFISGNTIIGGSATDGGQKLQVNGDTIMTGSGNTSGTTALSVRNSDGTTMFRFLNDGELRLGNLGGAAPIIYTSDGSSAFGFNLNGRDLVFNARHTTQEAINGMFGFVGNVSTVTTGTSQVVNIARNFEPTSGTAVLNYLQLRPAINQTGGANGITRGLYVNPNLVAAADWRSIETSNNSGWAAYFAGSADLFVGDGADIQFGTTNGTKLGTSTSQKIGFWNATPIVQPTTAVAGATRVGGGGTNVTDTDTFDGYTIAQVVKALRNAGLLA